MYAFYLEFETSRPAYLFRSNRFADVMSFIGKFDVDLKAAGADFAATGVVIDTNTQRAAIDTSAGGNYRSFDDFLAANEETEYHKDYAKAALKASEGEMKQAYNRLTTVGESMSKASRTIRLMEAAAPKQYTPEQLASNPPKFVTRPDIWKKIVMDKGHTSYGQAVSHYKSKLKMMGIQGL